MKAISNGYKVVKHNDGTYWKVWYVKAVHMEKRSKRITYAEYKKYKK